MQRQIIVVFLSLFWLLLPGAYAADRGALFKVSSKGHTLHLFGTMHVGLAEFYPLEARISNAVANASTLALEIDPLQDPAALMAAVVAHGMLPSDAQGYQERSPALRKRVEKALTNAGVDPAAMARFKPWMVATTLALGEYAAQGYRTDLSVDLRLAQMARAGKVRIVELESVSGQLGMFNSLSSEEQWRFLEESIDVIDSGRQKAEVKQIVDAWRYADQAALEAVAARAASDTTVSGRFVQKVMLEERNVPLTDKLVQLLEREDKAVAAVGVLHLLGDKGIPALLRARGITVERIY